MLSRGYSVFCMVALYSVARFVFVLLIKSLATAYQRANLLCIDLREFPEFRLIIGIVSGIGNRDSGGCVFFQSGVITSHNNVTGNPFGLMSKDWTRRGESPTIPELTLWVVRCGMWPMTQATTETAELIKTHGLESPPWLGWLVAAESSRLESRVHAE